MYMHVVQIFLFINVIFLSGLPTTGQSPINLDDRLVRKRKYPPLVLNGHWLNDGEARLLNTGTTGNW